MCLNSRYVCKIVTCNVNVWLGVQKTMERPLSGVFAKLLIKFFLIYNLNYSGI